MSLYNLLYYSKNYKKTSGSLYNYYRDEPNSGNINNPRGAIRYTIVNSKSFNYKASLTGKLQGNNTELENIEVAVPLKYLSKFFRTSDIPLINYDVSLDSKWSKNRILTSVGTRNAVPVGADHVTQPSLPARNNPADVKFDITDCNFLFLFLSNN